MNEHINIPKMVSKTSKGLQSCSTPEYGGESPSRDSDSFSEASSPVPFLCTQDGAESIDGVVWNYNTPKAERSAKAYLKNSTPLSRKSKRTLRSNLIDKPLPRRRNLRNTQKNTQLFQDLIELNQNLHELISKKPQQTTEKQHSGSEDDIFRLSPECSPKGTRRLSSNNCLRKNVLSSNFNKPETENVLDSDDSINECLIKASQIVEDIIMDEEPSSKRPCYEYHNKSKFKQNDSNSKFKKAHDSMDAILGNIKLESPRINKLKKCESPCLKDDSFDTMFDNLNDSVFEQLTQMPVKLDVSSKKNELKVVDGSPMSKSFGRHNSMPESPSIVDNNKPSTSGMVFGRYNSMPYDNHTGNTTVTGDSPIRCTPDEIKRKHQLAREKLLAKRLLPFTSSQCQVAQKNVPSTQNNVQSCTNNIKTNITIASKVKNSKFQPKLPVSASAISQNCHQNKNTSEIKTNTSTDLKILLEQKRQEALMRLRRRQQQNKVL